MHKQLWMVMLLLVGAGCARGPRVWQGGAPHGYSLFSITLHCDDAYEAATEDQVPTVSEMVERELAGDPWIPGEELEAPEGWGVPFDSCDALLQTLREGADDLLPAAKYGRAGGY